MSTVSFSRTNTLRGRFNQQVLTLLHWLQIITLCYCVIQLEGRNLVPEQSCYALCENLKFWLKLSNLVKLLVRLSVNVITWNAHCFFFSQRFGLSLSHSQGTENLVFFVKSVSSNFWQKTLKHRSLESGSINGRNVGKKTVCFSCVKNWPKAESWLTN